ncbi:MAG TPA: MBL fold metallo-hydrolase [Candidatus Binatia bacterium]|nr:MBL fold metallo-hydrolase [Candidatus Binatia bacterium]
MTDAVALGWSADLGGATVRLLRAGRFRTDAGALFGPVPRVLWEPLVRDELDELDRVWVAANCLLIEIGGRRVLVESGLADLEPATAARIGFEGSPVEAALAKLGVRPAEIDLVVLSHLHADHAGGIVAADGELRFPSAPIVVQAAELVVALRRNPRLAAAYDQPRLRGLRTRLEAAAVEGEVELVPGLSVVPTGGHSGGHQVVVVRGRDATLCFAGDLAPRPWAANPRWITTYDDFPLTSVARKVELFRRAAEEGWLVVCSHEPEAPVGRLVRDGDRFRYEGLDRPS